MLRLVEVQFLAAGDLHRGQQSPAGVLDGLREFHALLLQLFDGGLTVRERL